MLAASSCALAIMLAMTTKVTRNHLRFKLHLEAPYRTTAGRTSLLCEVSEKDLASWLKTRSTGADVHGVQNVFQKVASSMKIVCYSSQDAKVFRPQFHKVPVG